MSQLNDIQRKAAAAYDDGIFSHCESMSDAREVGDGLFAFILGELNDKDVEGSPDEAIRRLEIARTQIEEVIHAL